MGLSNRYRRACGRCRRGAAFSRLGILLVLVFWVLIGRPAGADLPVSGFFRIGTGFVGGVYYPIGDLIARGISDPRGGAPCAAPSTVCGVPGLIGVAQTSNGSVANIAALRDGDIEAALVQADVVHWAFHGIEIYADTAPMTELRAIAGLYPELLQIVTRRDAGVRSIQDLRGRRISLDEPGSGTLVDMRLVLQAFGLSEADLRPEYLKPVYAIDRIKHDDLDGFTIMAGVPTGAVETLADQGFPIALTPVEGPAVRALMDRFPFIRPGTIPAGVYPGVPETQTIRIRAHLVTTADLDADLIHAVTEALWSPRTQALLAAGHPQGRTITLETAADGLAVPLHDGALRVYREKGVLD